MVPYYFEATRYNSEIKHLKMYSSNYTFLRSELKRIEVLVPELDLYQISKNISDTIKTELEGVMPEFESV